MGRRKIYNNDAEKKQKRREYMKKYMKKYNQKTKTVKSLNKKELLQLNYFKDIPSKSITLSELRKRLNQIIVDFNLPKRGCSIQDINNLIPSAPATLKPSKRYIETDEYQQRLIKKEEVNYIKAVDNLMNISIEDTQAQIDKKRSRDNNKKRHQEFMASVEAADNIIKNNIELEYIENRLSKKKLKKYVNKYWKYDLNNMTEHYKKYALLKISKQLFDLTKKIDFNQTWWITYSCADTGKTRQRKLDDKTVHSLINQLRTEGYLNDIAADMEPIYAEETDSNSNFFPMTLNKISSISLKDAGTPGENVVKPVQKANELEYPNDPTLKFLRSNNASAELINNRIVELNKANKKKKPLNKRVNSFWKYTCTIPIDLSKFMIFNSIDKDNASIINKYPCLVYACMQSNVDKSIIDYLKTILKIRAFPLTKLQDIANETGLEFIVHIITCKTEIINYTPKNREIVQTVKLVSYDKHYMVDEDIPISPFFIRNYEAIMSCDKLKDWSFDDMCKINKSSIKNGVTYYYKSEKLYNIVQVIDELVKQNYFKPITYNDIIQHGNYIFDNTTENLQTLYYDSYCSTRLKQPPKYKTNSRTFKRDNVFFADFECSTDGIHKEYCICYISEDGSKQNSFYGIDCATRFLDEIPTNSLIYFQFLSYDMNFLIKKLDRLDGTPFIKDNKTLKQDGTYKGKCFRFVDSANIINAKLEEFPKMFNLETGPKEVFPYQYYTQKIIENKVGNINDASRFVSDVAQFNKNIDYVDCRIDNDKFDLEKYALFYCMRDVLILQQGFNKFRVLCLKELDIDVYDYISAPSVANAVMEKRVYFPNKNLYDLGGIPREFISRCVYGGVCMMSNNKKQIINNSVSNLDAVSLYATAMSRLYTLEGKPSVLSDNMLSVDYLLNHLFLDDQIEPNNDRFISAFFIHIKITKINKFRSFPTIIVNKQVNKNLKNVNTNSNVCCEMYVDNITLGDLVNYQGVECDILQGYYYSGKRDITIRQVVKDLFKLRKENKGNPLEKIIKLILNSAYGKTILKPIDTKYKFKDDEEIENYMRLNYYKIIEVDKIKGSNKHRVKEYQNASRHYNFCPLGVQILSMSKHVMNEVYYLAEDNNIDIFYRDNDSIHMYTSDVNKLSELFENKYNRLFLGDDLGCFHSDFEQISHNNQQSYAYQSIFCMKKCYLDCLTNQSGEIGFHARMKGINYESISITANKLFPNSIPVKYCKKNKLFIPDCNNYNCKNNFSIIDLYKNIYNGNPVTFDLCIGKQLFELKHNYSVETRASYKRTIKINQ